MKFDPEGQTALSASHFSRNDNPLGCERQQPSSHVLYWMRDWILWDSL